MLKITCTVCILKKLIMTLKIQVNCKTAVSNFRMYMFQFILAAHIITFT